MSLALSIDDPAYFDRLATVESAHWWPLGMWRIADHWLDRTILGRTSLRALDVGCGTGGTLARLRSRPEIEAAFGVDPSRPAVAKAPSCVALGSALAMPFSSGLFDVATCFDVLQHLRPGTDGIAMREILRVLKPGGVAVLRANGKGVWPPRRDDPQPYDLRVLAASVEDAGFVLHAWTYANCAASVADEILGRLRPGRGHGHPAGGGLRIRPIHPLRNYVMSALSRAEAFAIGRLGFSLPVGHSTMLLARKPGEVVR